MISYSKQYQKWDRSIKTRLYTLCVCISFVIHINNTLTFFWWISYSDFTVFENNNESIRVTYQWLIDSQDHQNIRCEFLFIRNTIWIIIWIQHWFLSQTLLRHRVVRTSPSDRRNKCWIIREQVFTLACESIQNRNTHMSIIEEKKVFKREVSAECIIKRWKSCLRNRK